MHPLEAHPDRNPFPLRRFAEFELDTSLFQLRRKGEIVDLAPRAFDVLAYLVEHRGRLVSRDELISQVWGATALSGSSVPTCITAVRRALGDDPARPRFVATHRSRGYRFVAEVRQEAAAVEAFPRSSTAARSRFAPEAGAGDPSRPGFVGRDEEFAALCAAFEASLSGSPQLVLVAGEAGIGKTRTLEEFSRWARAAGAAVLPGGCGEGAAAPALWPWVPIVRACIDGGEGSNLPAELAPVAASLLQTIPELIDRLPDLPPAPSLDAEPARFRLFDRVTALLGRAAAERPVVVLLDELQHADAASLRLLRFAARELRDARVLLIGAHRDPHPPADDRRAELLAELARQPATRCLRLRGLSCEDVERLIAPSVPRGTATGSLAADLSHRTGGNPRILGQIAQLLALARNAAGATGPRDERPRCAECAPGRPAARRFAARRVREAAPASPVG